MVLRRDDRESTAAPDWSVVFQTRCSSWGESAVSEVGSMRLHEADR